MKKMILKLLIAYLCVVALIGIIIVLTGKQFGATELKIFGTTIAIFAFSISEFGFYILYERKKYKFFSIFSMLLCLLLCIFAITYIWNFLTDTNLIFKIVATFIILFVFNITELFYSVLYKKTKYLIWTGSGLLACLFACVMTLMNIWKHGNFNDDLFYGISFTLVTLFVFNLIEFVYSVHYQKTQYKIFSMIGMLIVLFGCFWMLAVIWDVFEFRIFYNLKIFGTLIISYIFSFVLLCYSKVYQNNKNIFVFLFGMIVSTFVYMIILAIVWGFLDLEKYLFLKILGTFVSVFIFSLIVNAYSNSYSQIKYKLFSIAGMSISLFTCMLLLSTIWGFWECQLDFSETIFQTIIIIGVYNLIVLIYSTIYNKTKHKFFALSGVSILGITCAWLLLNIWGVLNIENPHNGKILFTIIMFLGTSINISLLQFIKNKHNIVVKVKDLTIYLTIILNIMAFIYIWNIIPTFDFYKRLIIVDIILVTLGTIISPILSKLYKMPDVETEIPIVQTDDLLENIPQNDELDEIIEPTENIIENVAQNDELEEMIEPPEIIMENIPQNDD